MVSHSKHFWIKPPILYEKLNVESLNWLCKYWRFGVVESVPNQSISICEVVNETKKTLILEWMNEEEWEEIQAQKCNICNFHEVIIHTGKYFLEQAVLGGK